MQKTDFNQFSEIIMALQETYTPEKPVSKEKVKLYFNLFSSWNWTIEEFQKACFQLFETKKISTFPLPAEIREALIGDKALQAWLTSREAVATYGQYRSIKFKDPAIHSVIEAMGGWEKFNYCSEEERPWKQKEFERLYGVLQHRSNHPSHVTGICEIHNKGTEYAGLIDLSQSTLKIEAVKCSTIAK